MNIGFDASMIVQNKAGIGHYALELLHSLILRSDIDCIYTYISSETVLPSDILNSKKIKIIKINQKVNALWFLRMGMSTRKQKLQFTISPSNFILGIWARNVYQIVHDISPILYPQFVAKSAKRKFYVYMMFSIVFAKKLLCVSSTTKQQLLDKFPLAKKKSVYIGFGMHKWVLAERSMQNQNETKLKYDLPEKYILSVGTLQPRKNIESALVAFSRLLKHDNEYYFLIVGGKGWFYETIFSKVKELNLEQKVRFLGYISDEELIDVIDFAKAMIFISYHEGVGLPPLEASVRGVPVLASNIDVHKELLPTDTTFVDPHNLDEISSSLIQVIEKPHNKNLELLSKYNWTDVADRIMNIYSDPLRASSR